MAEVQDTEFLSICNELDNLAVHILTIIRNIMLERQYLDSNLTDGFINMAKSRYLMRGQKISKHQINNSNLNPSTKVISSDQSINGVKFTSFHILKKKLTSVSGEVLSEFDSESYFTEDETVKSETDENNEFQNVSRQGKNAFSSFENPLHWFGLLVPDSLKLCQSRFEQVLETSVKIVSLQNELKALCEKYRNLRQKK